MKLSCDWEAKLEKIYNLGNRRLCRARKSFYKPTEFVNKEWDAKFYRLIEKVRAKVSGKNNLWDKKLSCLAKCWNIWFYQLRGQKPCLHSEVYKKHNNWHSRFFYMRKRFYQEHKRYGWERKIDTLRRMWTDTGKQIRGGIGNMDTTLENERLGITDLRQMLLKQDYRCALSGRKLTPQNCSLDHIIPLGEGGTHTKDNAQLVTEEVNRAKGRMTEEEFINLCRDIVENNRT